MSGRKKQVGRPAGKTRKLSRDDIVSAALHRLENEGARQLSMRALARDLHVDPMALYHYFDDRQGLLEAIVIAVFAEFEADDTSLPAHVSWRSEVEALAERYWDAVAKAPEFMRMMCRGEITPVATIETFYRRLESALAELKPTVAQNRLYAHVLVDFIHGFALASTENERAAFLQELSVILSGIAVSCRSTDSIDL